MSDLSNDTKKHTSKSRETIPLRRIYTKKIWSSKEEETPTKDKKKLCCLDLCIFKKQGIKQYLVNRITIRFYKLKWFWPVGS
jgi:hypothetical protein